MEMNVKKVSSVLVVLLVVMFCFGSYRLGVKHGQETNAADSRDRIEGPESSSAGIDQDTGPDSGVRRDREERMPDSVQVAAVLGEDREKVESAERDRLMRNLENNMAMPGMNRIIQEQQRVLMADQYRNLIDVYGLNEKEKEYFLDLLTARQMLRVDMGMKLVTGMLSETERNELLEKVGAGIDEMDKEIDWFLNNEADSDYFQYYERTEGERAIVDSVSDQLSQAGSPLEEGMDRELVAIMHEEISDYPFSVEFEENGEPVFSRFTQANIDTFVQEMQALRDPMIQKASEVLGPEQLEVFSSSFDQYVALYDQRLRMVQQLFNPAQ